MTFAIYYHPEAYTTSSSRLMGRNAAGESFLRGYFSYTPKDQGNLFVQVQDESHGSLFEQTARQFNRTEQVSIITKSSLETLGDAAGLYYPGPDIGELASHRRLYGDHLWSLCGITHTTSSAGAMDSIVNLTTTPVMPWDSIICTSNSVKANVECIFSNQFEFLQKQLGAQKLTLPMLPVIPLGVHTTDFIFNESVRERSRASIGASPDTLVVLYMGRLSFHAKAHPISMYQGLESAAKATGKNIVLIECGWHANDALAKAFEEAAALCCPSVRTVQLDGREARNREIAWSSADVFCSLSDNIQETFGIVPIEAMAAGLPVVVSDWDGYKDSVRDGIDGFRVKTLSPSPGLAGDLACRHALGIDNYDMYCGHASTLVAVDTDAVASSFTKLFESESLRRRMGEAGRHRAQTLYDWSTIFSRYSDLWTEQNEIRIRENSLTGLKSPDTAQRTVDSWPARLDPTISFSSYPTEHLTRETPLRLGFSSSALACDALDKYLKLKMVNYAGYVIPSITEIQSVLDLASTDYQEAEKLLAGVDARRRLYVLRGLVWMIKIGLLRL
jgi:starch synthase